MKFTKLLLGTAAIAAFMATSCNSDDVDPKNNVYTNIVTVSGISTSGTQFTLRQENDSKLLTYYTTQPVSGDATKTGDRIVITYQMTEYDQTGMGGTPPFCNGTVNVLGAVPTIGKGGEIPVVSAAESAQFKSSQVEVNSVWRTGEYLNVVFLKYTDGKYKQCRIVADETTLDEEYPHLYLIFEPENEYPNETYPYAFYASYSLMGTAGRPNAKGVILHFNDDTKKNEVQIERGTLGDHVSIKPSPID